MTNSKCSGRLRHPTCKKSASYEVVTKLLRSCDEVAQYSYEVAAKFLRNDPLRIPCASPASPHPSIKEAALRAASTKGGGGLRRPPPFVDSFMDGCVGASPKCWHSFVTLSSPGAQVQGCSVGCGATHYELLRNLHCSLGLACQATR